MITAVDAAELGTQLFDQAGENEGVRFRYRVDPTRMTAMQKPCVSAEVPILTGHGDGQRLAAVIHSYHQWGKPIFIGLIQVDGLFQFWVEKDDPE